MKKMFALMLAVLLLVSMVPTAMAYTAVTPTNQLKHTMALTNTAESALDCTITYTFAITDGVTVVEPQSYVAANIEQLVEGNPTVTGQLQYDSDDTFTNRQCTKDLPISWNGVSFKQPGIYRWSVTKSVSDTNNEKDPSNMPASFYLYVYVSDNNGTLTPTVVLTTATDKGDITSENKGNLTDSYPARTVDLEISKTVSGAQGSRDQYFKFTLSITPPAGAESKSYTIEGVDTTIPVSAYNASEITYTPTITLTGGQQSTIDLWLKHGQTAKITDLIYGSSYTITETAVNGYSVSYVATEGSTAGDKVSALSYSDTSIQLDSTVAFNNEKNIEVPTGITLNTAAPVAGILLAISLLGILFIGKRKEYAA